MNPTLKNEPPFWGAKLIHDVPLKELYPLIDTRLLFSKEWQFKTPPRGINLAEDWIEKEARPAFDELKSEALKEGYLKPQIVYGYYDRAGQTFAIKDSKILTRIPDKYFSLQLVTVGDEVARRCFYLYSENKYKNYLYLHGFAVAVTEALAEYSHRLICSELGIDWNESMRISPGYPVWPNLTDQEKVVGLLEGKKIGVSLTETYQLVPEFSTTAMILL